MQAWRDRVPWIVDVADDELRFLALALKARDRRAALGVEQLADNALTFAVLLDELRPHNVDTVVRWLDSPTMLPLRALAGDVGPRLDHAVVHSVDDDVAALPDDLRGLTELVVTEGLAAVATSTVLWPPFDAWWTRSELLSGMRQATDHDWPILRQGIARELRRRRDRALPAGLGTLDGLDELRPGRAALVRAIAPLRPSVVAWSLEDVVDAARDGGDGGVDVSHDGKHTFTYREGRRKVRVVVDPAGGGLVPHVRLEPPHVGRGLRRRALERVIDALFDVVPLPGLDDVIVDQGTRLVDVLVALAALSGGGAGGGAPAAVDQRVIWQLARRGPHLEVSARCQRRGKRGEWSTGAPVSFDDVARGLFGADADDKKAAAAFVRTMWTKTTARFTSQNGAALAGHPRVRDEERQPVEVACATARLVVDDADDGGLRLRLLAEDQPLAPDELSNDPHTDTGRVLQLPRAVGSSGGSGTRVLVVDVDAGLLEVSRALRMASHVSAADRERLTPALLALETRVPIELPASIRGELVTGDPRPVVRLRPTHPGLAVDVGVRPLRGSDWFPAGRGPPVVPGTITRAGDEKFIAARRDFAGELARADALWARPALATALSGASSGALSTLRFRGTGDAHSKTGADVDDDEDALAVLVALRALVDGGDDLVVEWPEGLAVVGQIGLPQLQLRVRRPTGGSGTDWLQVDADIDVDDDALTLALLLQAVREGRRFVRLSPGRFAALEESLRRRLIALAALGGPAPDGAAPDGSVALPSAAASTLLGLGGDVRFADEGTAGDDGSVLRELQARAQQARDVDDQPPRALLATLRPYQRDGLQWMRRLQAWGTGAVLADDMGLGKTLQALAVLLERAPRGPALVVAPTSVTSQWIDEAAKFAPTLRCRLLDARGFQTGAGLDDKPGPFDVVVCTWTRLALAADALAGLRFATAVFDEAQMLKNLETRRAAAARAVDADWRLALTGTPIENHSGELWSLMRVVSPGLLGSAAGFRERFQVPIEREHDVARRQALSAAVRPFILRRTKSEVAPELPARTEVVLRVPLPDDEARAYDAVRRVLADELTDERTAPRSSSSRAARSQAAGVRDDRIRILAMITRLRLRACHPGLDDEAWLGSTAKLDAAVQLISSLVEARHQVLVFSSFTRVLDRLEAPLTAAGARLTRLDGTTTTQERKARVTTFQQGDADVFLLSLKAGGTGLNLTAADYVVLFDPWWNAAAEAQAADRAHRIGQTRPVTIHRLIAQGTIEEQVLALQQQKSQLIDALLEGTATASSLDVDALAGLVTGAAATLAEVQRASDQQKTKKKTSTTKTKKNS